MREKWVKNIFGRYLVGGRRGEKIDGGLGVLSLAPPKCFLPKMGRKLRGKLSLYEADKIPICKGTWVCYFVASFGLFCGY